MNTEIVAMIGGVAFVGVCWWINRRADDGGAGVQIGQEPPVEDLRLLRICHRCRRYQGPRREVHFGQHLNIVHDICPDCAKRRDAEVAAATDTKVQKLALA